MTKSSREAAYFDAIYEQNPDPWNFTASPYEQEKYRESLGTLGERKFGAGLEVGCSIGVFTAMLAPRCNTLLAVDIADAALAQARARCATLPNVTIKKLYVPREFPAESYELIVLSEVLYFLTAADIAQTAAMVRASLAPQGRVLLVNYTAQIDEPCSGDDAAEIFLAAAGLPAVVQLRRELFRLDLLGK
jgi:SAM-dependent methyltransferase